MGVSGSLGILVDPVPLPLRPESSLPSEALSLISLPPSWLLWMPSSSSGSVGLLRCPGSTREGGDLGFRNVGAGSSAGEGVSSPELQVGEMSVFSEGLFGVFSGSGGACVLVEVVLAAGLCSVGSL